ncbi:MAG: SpoIIE family protein phosphatase [Bacteroidales bacterium]|nr:SpoIIE family protein phosphatase [Bacteroidales bacterium]
MQKDLKIKLWYLFKVNRKQFIWIYLFLSDLVVLGGVWAYYYNPVLEENASWITKFYFNNDVVFWFVFLLYTIIEALVFWNNFNKEHIKIINKQNAELEQQKEEIAAQKEEISSQRDEAIAQRDKIEDQNKLITSSIHYAERIQQAVLPLKKDLEKSFDNFILFKPRDIVSGDFYWFREAGNVNIIAAADCTGHGVPGAFVSMLGISLLNEIVGVRRIIKSNEILNTLRTEIKKSLHQRGETMEQQDGMDIAIVVIDKVKKKIDFSGANNSLYFCTKNQFEIADNKKVKESIGIAKTKLYEVKPDRMPIGIYTNEKDFNSLEFSFQNGDILYMFSDGYIDQFGGKTRQKFTSKRFKSLIIDNAEKQMHEQKAILIETLKNWQGKNEQIDDILVMGIKLNS